MMASVYNSPITYHHMVNSNEKLKFYTVHQRLTHPQDPKLLAEPSANPELIKHTSSESGNQLIWLSAKEPKQLRYLAVMLDKYLKQPAGRVKATQQQQQQQQQRQQQRQRQQQLRGARNLPHAGEQALHGSLKEKRLLRQRSRSQLVCELLTRLAELDIQKCLSGMLSRLKRALCTWLNIGGMQRQSRAYYIDFLHNLLSIGCRNTLNRLQPIGAWLAAHAWPFASGRRHDRTFVMAFAITPITPIHRRSVISQPEQQQQQQQQPWQQQPQQQPWQQQQQAAIRRRHRIHPGHCPSIADALPPNECPPMAAQLRHKRYFQYFKNMVSGQKTSKP